jgi:hypothetical protein
MDHAIVPLDERTAEQMSDKRARERVATNAGEFRMSRIDGVANLREGTRYGQLQDVIISRNGDVKAVIVDTSFGPGGLRAIPFQSASFDFDRNVYNLPYGRDQVGTFRPFDYARYEVAAPVETKADTAAVVGVLRARRVLGRSSRRRRLYLRRELTPRAYILAVVRLPE